MADPVVVAAFISAGPATIAAWAALRVKANTSTNHGKNIGQHVEELGDKLDYLSSAFVSHSQSDADNFTQLHQLVLDQAESIRQNTRDRAREIQDGE